MPALLVGAGVFVLSGLYRCPVHALTGVPCPGCGLTRAAWLALHGDVAGATRMHPLVWVVVPFVAFWLGLEVRGYLRTGQGGESGRVKPLLPIGLTIAVAMFALWLARFAGAFGGPVR